MYGSTKGKENYSCTPVETLSGLQERGKAIKAYLQNPTTENKRLVEVANSKLN